MNTSTRIWCCNTALTEPHVDGCPYEPTGPFDYSALLRVEGMQRVDCPLCGQNMGFQSADMPIDWEEWQHTRCPGRLAQQWDMTRDQVEKLTQDVESLIGVSLADLLPDDPKMSDLRTRLAAEHVLELLARRGYKLSESS